MVDNTTPTPGADPAPAPSDPADDPTAAAPEGNDVFDSSFDEFADAEVNTEINPPHDAAPDPAPEPEPITDPVPGPAPTPDPAPASPDPADIWANATPEQKAAYEAAEQRWRSVDGRAAADRRRINELESDLKKRPAAPEAADQAALLDTVFESDAWKTLEEEDPDGAEAQKAVLTTLINATKANTAAVETISNDHQQSAVDAEIAIVAENHPDWQAVTKADFTNWLNDQPGFLKAQFDRNADVIVDGHEVADLITRYKASDKYVPAAVDSAPSPAPVPATPAPVDPAASPAPAPAAAPEPNKRDRDLQARLEGNVHVPTKGSGPPSGAPDNFDDAFDYWSDKIKASG